MVTEIDPVPLIARTLADIEDRRRMAAGIRIMATRRGDFTSELEMKLTGVSMVPDARTLLNDALTVSWNDAGVPDFDVTDEVIIGGGYAAATYAACRVAAGYPRPIVLERSEAQHVGGTFALSGLAPAWYLNSENRAGMAGLPADGDALNNLPGGILQASMVSAGEYPTNADMAWVIRLTLAQYARVYPGVSVTRVTDSNTLTLAVNGGVRRSFTVGRVIDMRGLGDPRDAEKADGERVLTFDQFMARQASDFPLQGWKRVAIIGGGDGGKCAAEAMLGIGPARSMSVKGLDQVSRIGWYARSLPRSTETWRANDVYDPADRVRTRYMRLGSYLPSDTDPSVSHDLTIFNESGSVVKAGGQVLVNGRAYDHAVLCTGYQPSTLTDGFRNDYVTTGTLRIARQTAFAQYKAGVAADIPFQSIERGYSAIDANTVAMFRNGPRIAALAGLLPSVGLDNSSYEG